MILHEDRAVFAGTPTQVRLILPSVTQSVQVPTNVLRYTPGGVEVVTVNDAVLEVRPIKLGRDFGRTVEILIGLT